MLGGQVILAEDNRSTIAIHQKTVFFLFKHCDGRSRGAADRRHDGDHSGYDDRTPDMAAQVILIAFVGVWGYLTCSAILLPFSMPGICRI